MTLKQFVLDTVAKTPSPQVYGEVCDLLVANIKRQGGSEDDSKMASEFYLTEIKKKFPSIKL